MNRSTALRILAPGLLFVGTMCSMFSPELRAQDKKPEPAPVKLKVGDTAPDFKLQYFDGHDLKDVNLNDYRGKKNVVVAFYVFAFTGG
jgi:AhpC/TSA family